LVGCGAARDEGEPASPAATVEERAETAKSKAEALEEKASSESDGARPSPGELITPAEAQAVDPKGKESLDDAITCLARSIYWEARGDGQASMEAVASVVMNRLGRTGFPDTVCGVVKEGRESGTCQFSWWCDGRPDTAQETERYEVAKEVARKALNRQLADRTQGATYFHHKRVKPTWSKVFTRTAAVGGHWFYKPKEPEKPRSEVADPREASGVL
jgi:spore germination cell wall hydrolase CwlJ-like protein